MQELVNVKGFNTVTGAERWFNLPTSEDNKTWLKDFCVKVPYEYEGSRDEAKYYVRKYLTDDEELPKLLDMPSNLYELDNFLTRWLKFDKLQKQTVVALGEAGYDPNHSVYIVENGEAKITNVCKPCLLEDDDDRAIGEYYLEDLLACNFFGRVPGFFRVFFDTVGFGRAIRLTGGYGFWSDIYDRWVDLTPWLGNRCFWYQYIVE